MHLLEKYVGSPCFRDGKLNKVTKWVNDNNFDLSQASFYSDSFNDLPLIREGKKTSNCRW